MATTETRGLSMKPNRSYSLLLLLFFLSGACALVYEIVWQRMLHLVFGNTAHATATVLAAFMAGLAAGSWGFGRVADRTTRPLRMYALLELGIGLCAVVFPLAVTGISELYVAAYRAGGGSSGLNTALRVTLCFGALFVPALLMGGTLPVAAKFAVTHLQVVGRRVGALYGVNMLGAVVGCVGAGFFLVVLFGAREVSWTAGCVNLLIGIIVLAAEKRMPAPVIAPVATPPPAMPWKRKGKRKGADPEVPVPAAGTPAAALLLTVAAGSGFCAMACEVMWARLLVFFAQSSIYSFPTMVSVFLCGSGLGALVAARVADRTRRGLAVLGVTQLLIAVAVVAPLWYFQDIGDLMLNVWRLNRQGGWLTFSMAGFTPALLLVFTPAFLMGMVLPLAAQLLAQDLASLGRGLGELYAVNTVGAVLGSLVAGFAVIPMAGIARGLALTAALNVAAGTAALWVHFQGRSRGSRRAAVLALGLAVVMPAACILHHRPLLLYSPFFRDVGQGASRVVFYKEESGATVSVRELDPDPIDSRQYKLIEVNGTNVAGTPPMLRTTQLVQGHMPLLLFKACTGRDPQNAFILGFGTGESSHAITLHDIQRLDCLEMVPGELEANSHFHDINGDLLTNPKFHLTFNDARTFLLTTSTRYDVIESDAVHPDVDITTYTSDYFRICRDRLTPQGIFSSWIPLFNLSEANLKIMLRTMQEVFPHVMVWYTPNYMNMHALLMGTNEKLQIDVGALQRQCDTEPVHASLNFIGLDDAAAILSCFMIDEASFSPYTAAARVNSDNHMYLPYFIPRQGAMGAATVRGNLDVLARLSTPVWPYVLKDTAGGTVFESALARRLDVRSALIRGVGCHHARDFRGALAAFEEAQRLAGGNDRHVQRLLDEARLMVLLGTAKAYLVGGSEDDGIRTLRQAAALYPASSRAWHALGAALLSAGRQDEALQAYNRAVESAPNFAPAYIDLARFWQRQGKSGEARAASEKALALNPDMAEARAVLKQCR